MPEERIAVMWAALQRLEKTWEQRISVAATVDLSVLRPRKQWRLAQTCWSSQFCRIWSGDNPNTPKNPTQWVVGNWYHIGRVSFIDLLNNGAATTTTTTTTTRTRTTTTTTTTPAEVWVPDFYFFRIHFSGRNHKLMQQTCADSWFNFEGFTTPSTTPLVHNRVQVCNSMRIHMNFGGRRCTSSTSAEGETRRGEAWGSQVCFFLSDQSTFSNLELDFATQAKSSKVSRKFNPRQFLPSHFYCTTCSDSNASITLCIICTIIQVSNTCILPHQMWWWFFFQDFVGKSWLHKAKYRCIIPCSARCMFLDLPVRRGCGCRGIQADREAKAQAERARLRTKNSLRPVLVQLFQYYLFAALFYVNCIRVRIDKSADACPFQVNVNGRKQGEYRKESVQKRRHQFFPSSFEWIKYERLGVKTAEAPQKPWCICIPLAVQMGLQEARRREEDEQRRCEDEQRRREEETSTELEACSNSKNDTCRSAGRFVRFES